MLSSPTPTPSPTITKTSSLLDVKIDETAAGLSASFAKQLHSISGDSAAIIIEYIAAMKTEVNLSDHYRKDLIEVLCRFTKYNKNRPIKDLERIDILSFLDSIRKTETQDPLHKWIGTYNIYRMHLLRFFKWLYYPDIEPDKRPKPTSPALVSDLTGEEEKTQMEAKTAAERGHPQLPLTQHHQTPFQC
jgi:hypothetical protein